MPDLSRFTGGGANYAFRDELPEAMSPFPRLATVGGLVDRIAHTAAVLPSTLGAFARAGEVLGVCGKTRSQRRKSRANHGEGDGDGE